MSIFDEIKISSQLETAVKDTLNLWWDVFAKEVELQMGIPVGSLTKPIAFMTSAQVDRELSPPMPGIVVVSPGMGPTKPLRDGDGFYRTFWHIAIAVFVSAKDRDSTADLLRLYAGIARTIIIKKSSLGGFANGLTWEDESYD